MSENCSIIDIFTGSGRVVGNPDITRLVAVRGPRNCEMQIGEG